MRVFNVDISRKGISPVVQVTEHDAMSRFFTLVLRNGSSDYEPPENPTYSVWYKTKDSHGWYDTITEPDEGTHPAVVADGNAFTIEIAEQATTSCGELALMINGDDGYQLTVSGIITRSDDIPGYDGEEVENYYNVYITRMQENAARAENAADIAVAYGATVEVDEEAQQLNITHHSDTEGGVGWLFGSAVENSASGDPATFSDGANDVAVKSLVAEIMPVQSGSGDPSPSNIRPISGRTGLTVATRGKNLFDKTAVTRSAWLSTTTGEVESASSDYIVSDYILVKKGVTVYIPATGSVRRWFYDINKTPTTYLSDSSSLAYTPKGDGYIRVTINKGTVDIDTLQIEFGKSATAYEPYAGQTYPINWQTEAGTVYGGTLDVVSGVLTVDRAIITLDGSQDVPMSSGNRGYVSINDAIVIDPSNQLTEASVICDRLKPTSWGNLGYSAYNLHCAPLFGRGIGFRDDTKTTAADWKAYFTENPTQFSYKLATPQTYQLTPTEVRTILGGNNIYTDAGAVSVEYIADTKLYIDNKVAELQALILEN